MNSTYPQLDMLLDWIAVAVMEYQNHCTLMSKGVQLSATNSFIFPFLLTISFNCSVVRGMMMASLLLCGQLASANMYLKYQRK